MRVILRAIDRTSSSRIDERNPYPHEKSDVIHVDRNDYERSVNDFPSLCIHVYYIYYVSFNYNCYIKLCLCTAKFLYWNYITLKELWGFEALNLLDMFENRNRLSVYILYLVFYSFVA